MLDLVTDPQWSSRKPVDGLSDEDVYSLMLQAAFQGEFLLEPGARASVDMNLALHSALPKVEAGYQYYIDWQAARSQGCESWVDWYGDVICEGDVLRKLLEVDTIEAADRRV